MIEKNENYEYEFESVSNHKGIAIDLIAVPAKDMGPFPGKKGLLFMSEDKGKNKEELELGHEVWGFAEIKNPDNLQLAKMGLELIQQALSREDDAKPMKE